MAYIAVFLFMVNGQLAHMYMGEYSTEIACVRAVQQKVPAVLPEIKNGAILCVKKVEV
jgi:hypothetical protein